MKTFSLKKSEISKKWIEIDCAGQVLGRLATNVAIILRGKHKPTYAPHLACGDNVILINADQIILSGKKLTQKKFYYHTGYPGGIKSVLYKDLNPAFMVQKAIERMLRQSCLRRSIMANQLKIFNAERIGYDAQKPIKATITSLGVFYGN